MKPIFTDYEDIEHVLYLIEEQLGAPVDWEYPMETAHVLAARLRTELLKGGVDEASIVDGNELAFWTVPKLQPGTWEHAFADCLATLLTTFQTPYGKITDAEDALNRRQELHSLKEQCIGILVADKSRFRLKAVHKLKPLAEKGKNYGKSQSKAASAPRKLTIERQKSIAKEYWRLVKDGEKYGALKALSARFDVSTETIRTTAKKYKQN
jgi:hypothetical protein